MASRTLTPVNSNCTTRSPERRRKKGARSTRDPLLEGQAGLMLLERSCCTVTSRRRRIHGRRKRSETQSRSVRSLVNRGREGAGFACTFPMTQTLMGKLRYTLAPRGLHLHGRPPRGGHRMPRHDAATHPRSPACRAPADDGEGRRGRVTAAHAAPSPPMEGAPRRRAIAARPCPRHRGRGAQRRMASAALSRPRHGRQGTLRESNYRALCPCHRRQGEAKRRASSALRALAIEGDGRQGRRLLRARPSLPTARSAQEKSLPRAPRPRHPKPGAPRKATEHVGRMRTRLDKPVTFAMQWSEPCLLDRPDGEPGNASRLLPLRCRWAHARPLRAVRPALHCAPFGWGGIVYTATSTGPTANTWCTVRRVPVGGQFLRSTACSRCASSGRRRTSTLTLRAGTGSTKASSPTTTVTVGQMRVNRRGTFRTQRGRDTRTAREVRQLDGRRREADVCVDGGQRFDAEDVREATRASADSEGMCRTKRESHAEEQERTHTTEWN